MNQKLKLLILNALVASLYVVLTISLSFLSYDAIQFRISELLMILVLFNYRFIYGLSLGVLVSNIASPFSLDMLFGTLATVIALILVIVTKKILPVFIRIFFIVIVNALIVVLEIYIFYEQETAFYLTFLWVFLGEFCVIYILGLPAYYIINKNKRIKNYLEFQDFNQSR
jgi:uncharacterized membrane protein